MGVVFDNTRVFLSWNIMCFVIVIVFSPMPFSFLLGNNVHVQNRRLEGSRWLKLPRDSDSSVTGTLVCFSSLLFCNINYYYYYYFHYLFIYLFNYVCVCFFLLIFFSHWEVRSRPHCCHNPEHQGTGVRELEVPMNHNSTNRHAGFKNGFNYITMSYNYSFNLHATYM